MWTYVSGVVELGCAALRAGDRETGSDAEFEAVCGSVIDGLRAR